MLSLNSAAGGLPPIVKAHQYQRILLASNNRLEADQISFYLNKGGYETTVCRSIVESLERFSDLSPTIVMVDIDTFPNQAGISFYRKVRLNAGTRHLPIVVILDSESDPYQYLRGILGAADFVAKPVDVDVLRTRLAFLAMANTLRSADSSSTDERLHTAETSKFLEFISHHLSKLLEVDKTAAIAIAETAPDQELSQAERAIETKRLSEFLYQNIRRVDRISRTGSGLILIYLPGYTDERASSMFCQLQDDYLDEGGIPFRVGISASPEEGREISDLIASADNRLLDAHLHDLSVLSRSHPPSSPPHSNGAANYGKVMIIEDNPSIAALLVSVLDLSGFDKVIALNEPSALEILDTEKPDLAILDLNMRYGDGLQIIKELTARKSDRSQIPVIALASQNSEEEIIQALQLGIVDYIQKPFTAREVLARVKRALFRR